MKATPFHHSIDLLSSVAFDSQEDGRRMKKTCIALSSWPVSGDAETPVLL